MSTRRITVEEVLEAYWVTGLKPVRKMWLLGGNPGECRHAGGCPLTVIAMRSGSRFDGRAIREFVNQEFDPSFQMGFLTAVDSSPKQWFRLLLSRRYRQGFADGQAVAAAVFQKQGAQA